LKRTASILLLGILFFNWCGYRFLSSWLEDRANSALESVLDENQYNESQLISLKIPALHMGYYSNSKAFERVDGQIEIGGIPYKFVKRRLYKDSLELLCIPNLAANQLRTAKDEFFKLVNDLQHNGRGKHNSGSVKSFSLDYFTAHQPLELGLYALNGEKSFPRYFIPLPSSSLRTADQPPEISQIPA
jgi:hypothetical protein